MQLWDAVRVAPGATRDKAAYYISRTRASDDAVLAVAAVCLHQHANFAVGDQEPMHEQKVVLQATCAHTSCLKVMSCASIKEALRDDRPDPLACPAEPGSSCETASKHVVAFHGSIQHLLQDRMVVWDWCDVPGGRGMHFDCTVITLTGAFRAWRFEIDGKRHFKPYTGRRQEADWRKDALVAVAGVALLRLHYKDEPRWGQFIDTFLRLPALEVRYTPAYRHCLQHTQSLSM